MLKPIAAGLMCLGFVTLGVAISRGQDDEPGFIVQDETGLIVIDGNLSATEVKVGDAKENHPDEARPARHMGRFTPGPHVGDPQTRQMLDKIAASLKEEIQQLESEGKQEEAQQKAQSLRAIAFLLHARPHGGAVPFHQRHRDPKQTMEEIRKLHARLKTLVEQSSELPARAAGDRAKLQQEINQVKREIAERHDSLTAPVPVGGPPPQFDPGQPFPHPIHPPFPPGMAPPPGGRQPPGTPQFHGGGIGFSPGPPRGLDSSEVMALAHKAEALSQAAARLKEAGLDDQARPLQEQAEELRRQAQEMMQAEAEKHRAQAGGDGGDRGRFGPDGFGGRPPMHLHHAIHELQEQIQQLRKEVGELRELLQRKPAD